MKLPPFLAGHFTVDELHEALSDSLRPPKRRRTLLHFDALKCGICWQRLHQVADALDTLPSASGMPFDPVSSALRRLAAHRAPRAGGASRLLAGLRLTHRHWLRQAGDDQRGFCRLALEESRRQTNRQPASAIATAWATLELFEKLPCAPFAERACDLRALAHLYLADVLSAGGVPPAAREHFAAASDLLERGSGDPEIEARWFEVVAEDFLARGRERLALSSLESAYESLRSVEMPGRRAENLVHQGVALVRCRALGARVALRWAASRLASLEPSFPRLLALHYLAFAELRFRRHAEAGECLREAAPLYRELGTPLLRAQRAWLEGVLALETARSGDARHRLRVALARLGKLGLERDAAKVRGAAGGSGLSRLLDLLRRWGLSRTLVPLAVGGRAWANVGQYCPVTPP